MASRTPSLEWKEGVCGATTFSSSAQDCENGMSGAWHMSKLTRKDEDALRESCVERCMRCARCRFISFSIVWGDCSWYHDCEMGALKRKLGGAIINGYSSARVRETVALPPPAAEPRWQPPLPGPSLVLVYHIPKTGGACHELLIRPARLPTRASHPR
jgi:hypothetical protein